jgi:uncharacterized integral membrane protein (TIGR00698 family)
MDKGAPSTRPGPGLLLTGALGLTAVWLAGWPVLQAHGISPLTVAIILGMLVGNTLYPAIKPWAEAGVCISRQTLLRYGVVLYGFRLTLQDVGHVGWQGVAIDSLILASTFVLSLQLGTRLLGLDRTVAMLVGAGSAICGAAAVLAIQPLVRGRPEQASVAVTGVVIFGTISMFLYPLLYELNHLWLVIPAGPAAFGIYIGSTVHEVAQVVAAGRQIGSDDVAGAAVIAKMVRVMMLAPFLPILAAYIRARARRMNAQAGAIEEFECPVTVPAFALLFIAAVLFNSLDVVPHPIVGFITILDNWLLAAAMGALGIATHFGTLRRSGGRPLLLTFILFLWLVVGGAAVNRFIALHVG